MFTRKHFEQIAKVLGEIKPEYYPKPGEVFDSSNYIMWREMVEAFVKLFTQENPRFDANKFRLVASNGQPYWRCNEE